MGDIEQEIIAHIKNLLDGQAKPESICLVANTQKEVESYRSVLEYEFKSVYKVEDKGDDLAIPGLRVSTIHRVKGLEFDHVILVSQLKDLDIADDTSERNLQRRSLLYVAATRARKSLLVVRVGLI